MVSDAIVLDVGPVEFPAADLLAQCDGFEHGTIGMTAAAQIINLAGPRVECELPESFDEVMTMNIVSNLFPLVTEDAVRAPDRGAFHQIGQKPRQLGAGMGGLLIVRAGGPAGLFSAILPGWIAGRNHHELQPVTKEIKS